MNKLGILFWAILLLFAPAMFAQEIVSDTFSSNGQSRWYRGAVPFSPETPLRLIILFSGDGENVNEMEARGFNDYLGNNSMVVYPQPWFWPDGFTGTDSVDDFQMVEDLISSVASNYPINMDDICIGGFSSGGAFTYELICDYNSPTSTRPYTFKAFAVVSGFVDATYRIDCPVVDQVPLIAFHGTADPLVNYNGGTLVWQDSILADSVESIVDFWAVDVNGCDPNPTVTVLPDLVVESLAPSTPELLEYSCPCNRNTQLYRIVDGGHSWPSGNAFIDFFSANLDIVASELIADFFEFEACDSDTTTTGLDDGSATFNPNRISVYPNPVTDVLSIQTQSTLRGVELFSAIGETVLSSVEPAHSISVAHLAPGFYFLKVETEAGASVVKIYKN